MPKGCKYIYNNKTYTREEFMSLLAGGEYRNILASAEQPIKVKSSIVQNNSPVYFENLKKFASESSFPNKIEFKKAIQERFKSYVSELKKNYGKSFNPSVYDEKTKQYLSDALTSEAINAISEHPEAIGWYDEKTSAALDVMSVIHPEIATDEEARGAFILPLAVMSNGNLVDFNFELAEKQYAYYKKNGRFNPKGGFGLQQSGIKKSILLVNSLLDNGLSMSDINSFLTSKYRAGDLKVKVNGKNKNLASGELADQLVYGATILGPKIGNGFYMNLWGQFDQLTMDRWFMRTWGRLTGSLLKDDAKAVTKGKKRVSDALDAIKSDPKALAILKTVVPKLSGLSPADLAKIIEKASMDKKKRATLASNDKTNELRKAGNSLSKNISGEKEAPANGRERKFIRDVFDDVQSRLKNEQNIDISMADLQAVLWYPEKILYESFKGGQTFEEASEGYTSESAPDYFNAAKKLAIKLGKNETEINEALSRGRRSAERGVGTGDTGTSETIVGSNKEILGRITETIAQKKQATKKIKTKSRVSASPEQFSNNVAETIDRIKAATSEDGATLNIDGTVYEDGGLVVPAGSVNVSQKGVSAEGLYKFLKDNENNISSDIFKIGLYKFADRAEVSYDLNIVIPREHRDVALEFGKLAGQESLFDLDSYENIKTGSDGKNPINFTPEQLASIAEDLSNGELPDIEGMLKGTQAGSAVGGDIRSEWGGIKLGEVVSAEELPKIYDKMGAYADNSSNKFSGQYELTYVPVNTKVDKDTLVDDYDGDLEHMDRVNDMVTQLKRGEELPPVIYSGFFHDGQHRMAAHVELGRKKILAFKKVEAGQQSLVEDKFKQYEKGYNKVQAAEGGAKKRKANEELKNILADSPSAKYIIDNMSYIYKQLEDKGLASKNDQCPI